MKIGFAQINPTVGDLRGNYELIVGVYERLAAAGAELILTPELAMTGYPPQDLVLKSRFVPENLELLGKLHARIGDAALLVGFVDRNEGRGKPFRNAAALLERGKPIRKTYKSLLPTYDVFDEERYFQPAEHVAPFLVHGKNIGVTICEDIWTEHYLPRPLYDCEPVRSLVEQGAEIIVNLSSSPFSLHKPAIRYEMVAGQIVRLIAELDLAPGDRMPTEKELAAQLGASRTMVRDAVKILSATARLQTGASA